MAEQFTMFGDDIDSSPQALIELSAKQLESGWQQLLNVEFDQPYMHALQDFLALEQQRGKTIFPPADQIFTALNLTPLKDVKVVILGQDPYHGTGQAHGLSFSVPSTLIKLPPSLKNIYKELNADLGLPIPSTGNLTPWAEQGVLLLNAMLTVEEKNAGSHRKQGWETFTDNIIQLLSERCEGLVFVLWGAYAHKKSALIDESKHLVLKGIHPSPLSAHRGFFGSKPFSYINQYLSKIGKAEIDWSL
ncbi:MAG: uracil-DNA glycosylase [Oleispira sp.]|nr:uracil-DNA glycosylase [Oleispira sp.]